MPRVALDSVVSNPWFVHSGSYINWWSTLNWPVLAEYPRGQRCWGVLRTFDISVSFPECFRSAHRNIICLSDANNGQVLVIKTSACIRTHKFGRLWSMAMFNQVRRRRKMVFQVSTQPITLHCFHELTSSLIQAMSRANLPVHQYE